jgi:6,7-dimethyl-8-ribityllumazine synthase
MSDDQVQFDEELSGEGVRVGIVQSRFNAAITDAMTDGCLAELTRLGVAEDDVQVLSVPGALEIPVALKWLAQSGDVDCLVAIGCVVRGETYHFELVCNESGRGVSEVALTTGIPVANAILTAETDAQALARVGKGAEAARVAIEMANLSEEFD